MPATRSGAGIDAGLLSDGAPAVQYTIEPMDLANVRQNGVRSLEVMCFGCRHEVSPAGAQWR
jgi:hypothetical protein